MKLLYFGTVCEINHYNEMLKDCPQKPSVATIVFESALMEGFRHNGVELDILSFPMIPTYPTFRCLRFGGHIEALPSGYTCRWLKTINLPFFKQLSRRLDAKRALRRWIRENGSNGLIMTYSIPPFLVKDILRAARRHGVKVVAVIPDLLRDMYINEDSRSPLTKLKQAYLRPALKRQGDYDGYVYLTDAMHEVVAPDKPYMVMEGIADISHVSRSSVPKATPRAIMYAGMLHEKYGILQLLDAFEALEVPDAELWLFGIGTAVEEIERRAQLNPHIRYFGSVDRAQILAREQQATLLVNPRDPRDAFTRYSFPSKTIEYMLSGTPLLTTRLPGIPDEYFNHVFAADQNDCASLTSAMREALACSNEQLTQIGTQAQEFIIDQKNATIQASKILRFLNEVQNDSAYTKGQI